ncbi:MAG: DUF1232 domain-containing protein [Helicobacteraceae bacterium]|nr:DUF1232 domain-containing protein [Helicobacteraceae bacterium]
MSEINNEQQDKSKALRDSLAKDFNEKEAEEFASIHQSKRWYDDFMLLYEMITSKDYEITTKTKLIIAGTLTYVVLPMDVIPDFIPIVGWLDDIFILGLATSTLHNEIENFKIFRDA